MIFQPKDETKAIDYVKKLIGLGHNFEIITKYKNRSLPQNAYLHLILSKFSIEFGYELEYTKQEILNGKSIKKYLLKLLRIKKQAKFVFFIKVLQN